MLVAGIIEVAAQQPQVGANRFGVRHQRGGRYRVAADGRLAGAENAGFFEADRFARGAEEIGMVDVDAGDDGNIGVDHVDRVEAPAESYFEDRDVGLGAGQQVHDGQRGEFEIRQVDVGAACLDRVEGVNQRRVRRQFAIDPCAFIKVEEMRLDVEADLVARAQQDRLEHGAGRAFAVGTGHHDDRASEPQAHCLFDGTDTIEAHVDVDFGMARLEQGQPVGQSGGECLHGIDLIDLK